MIRLLYIKNHKKCRKKRHRGKTIEILLGFLVFAFLIGNAAAGLAGRLAGSLAFAAATVLGAFTQVAGFDGLDMFHNFTFC